MNLAFSLIQKKLDIDFDNFFKYCIDEILTTQLYMFQEVLVKILGLYAKNWLSYSILK